MSLTFSMVGGSTSNGVGGELERLDPVRLQSKGAPQPLDRRRRQAAGRRHRARAPMGGALGHGLQGADEQLGDPFVGDGARSAAAGLVAQTLEPVLGEALAPLADRMRAGADLAGHGLVGEALGAAQHDLGSQRQVLRGLAPADQSLQLDPLVCRQRQRRRLPLRHDLLPSAMPHNVTIFRGSLLVLAARALLKPVGLPDGVAMLDAYCSAWNRLATGSERLSVFCCWLSWPADGAGDTCIPAGAAGPQR